MKFGDLLTVLKDKALIEVKEGKTALTTANALYFKTKELYPDAKVIRVEYIVSKGFFSILIDIEVEG